MNADQQILLLLKSALTIGPIAVYFLALGYLNAHSRPRVLSGRSDFVLLAIVFFPVCLWALFLLANLPWMLLATLAFAAALAGYWMTPRRRSCWVVYNVTERQFRRALDAALDSLGHAARDLPAARPGHPTVEVAPLGLRITVSPFPLLANVTCRFERTDGQPVDDARVAPLRDALVGQLQRVHTLPSASAAAFLLIGTAMLSAPLLMMASRMDEIVRVVSDLFA